MNAQQNENRVQNRASEHRKPTVNEGFHPLEVLVRRRWQLFGCLMIVGAVAITSMLLSRPRYKATAQVQVGSDKPESGGGGLASLMGQGGAVALLVVLLTVVFSHQKILDWMSSSTDSAPAS